MEPSMLLTLAQTLLQTLDSPLMKEFGSLWSFKHQLAKNKATLKTIAAVLRDAEEMERQHVRISYVDRDWLEKLKDAAYEADDVFDEVVYLAQHRNFLGGNILSKEVRLFFSRFNQLASGFNMSREVKKIRERLDDIAKDRRDFGLNSLVSAEARIVTKRREDSHSFVHVEDVIGRDQDKMALIDMLLDSRVEDDVSFVAIVGIGGLGKTTLAQLVFNDERIKRAFSDMKLWVCVSDEFDIRKLLCKLLKSATNENHDHLEMDQLHDLFRKKISQKKYLLVLDDIWNEDRSQWLRLRELLIGGERGSRVVLTTRSRTVAKIVGNALTYELKGLSEEDSWHLFENMAFETEEQRDLELIAIGKRILKKCASVPLAIRVVGSLLYGQSKSTWQTFENTDLAHIKQDDKDGILPILKLSYYHLESPLKSCFSYCAVFPKDFNIEKEILINLWMAHSFIVPLEDQSFEDAGEEYFMTLLQRCFFQDVGRDENGEIVSCKLHDLMHDVALEIAGTDILVEDCADSKRTRNTRHLSFTFTHGYRLYFSSLVAPEALRSFIHLRDVVLSDNGDTSLPLLLSKATNLRVLLFPGPTAATLPRAIDKLVHLRYLNLSYNKNLKFLPATVCKLYNLQTLDLKECFRLRELPKRLNRLVNLRSLNVTGCSLLTYMPPMMRNLTSLHRLSDFVVSSYVKNRPLQSQLADLEALAIRLTGSLKITVCGECATNDVPENKEAKYIRGLEYLSDISVNFRGYWGSVVGLQPPPHTKSLEFFGYDGATFPEWGLSEDLGAFFPDLVNFRISHSRSLNDLPLLNRLRHLKSLKLYKLENLVYIENQACSSSDESTFFPAIEKLELEDLPNLKGWRRAPTRMADSSNKQRRPSLSCFPYSFPRLSYLNVRGCSNLMSIPVSPNFKSLLITSEIISNTSLLASCECNYSEELAIGLSNVKSLSIAELFQGNLSSVNFLRIEDIPALEDLHLCGPDNSEGGRPDHIPRARNSLHENLHHLELFGLENLVNLPEGMKYLTALQSLHIKECCSLEVLPEWVSCLSSLQSIQIDGCEVLKSLPEAK